MSAAVVLVSAPEFQQENELRANLDPLIRKLHLTLMGIKADAIEATNVVRSPSAKRDMEKGLKDADLLLQTIKSLIQSSPGE